MNFFEQYFHLSPDGGSGMVEFTYGVAAVAIVCLIACRSLVLRYVHRLIARVRRLSMHHV